ncbi:MAG: thioredoxin family protein [Bryobacterales bacterium]|nr:thioredoxin family protein [Bryobacterales bacterium]
MCCLLPAALAQRLDPIQWSLVPDAPAAAPGALVPARLTARIEPGWHLYSLTTPKGPIPTTVRLLDQPAVARWEIYQPKPAVAFDPNFKLETETFENEAVFLIGFELAKDVAPGPVELSVQVRYQACDARQCLLPVRKTAAAVLRVDPAAAPLSALSPPAGYTLFAPAPSAPPSAVQPAPLPAQAGGEVQGLAAFLAIAFGFGLAAIFTPCVFPMIPITVSFFLNRQGSSRGGSLFQALVFCLGIIVLFSTLGLVTTAILGPFGTVQLGSSPWVNGFIALVFLVFGLSLLGAFEITLPSSLLTRMDRASQRGGVLGTLLMGLTFSLTAFACVGPFVGTLLAGSVSSGGARPLAGMVAFASGLALPFFLLAAFPSYLGRLPKSGGWMSRVKVVLGFIILAAMLKYLSNVDAVLHWNVITRQRFLALWVVLFSMAGLYLLGFLRMEGVKADERLGVGRLLAAGAFLAFALSLLPGMFGAGLGELDAYVPLAPERAAGWMKNDYRQALARARAENKRLFLNFTGYACTNCHWMKSNMFPRPEIAAALSDFVLVELYTDGADPASEENQKILTERFSTVAIPYYAILDANEKTIAVFAGLTRDPAQFLAFLRTGQ